MQLAGILVRHINPTIWFGTGHSPASPVYIHLDLQGSVCSRECPEPTRSTNQLVFFSSDSASRRSGPRTREFNNASSDDLVEQAAARIHRHGETSKRHRRGSARAAGHFRAHLMTRQSGSTTYTETKIGTDTAYDGIGPITTRWLCRDPIKQARNSPLDPARSQT